MDRKQHEQRIAQSLDLNDLIGKELQERVQAGKEYIRKFEAEEDARWERRQAETGIETKPDTKRK